MDCQLSVIIHIFHQADEEETPTPSKAAKLEHDESDGACASKTSNPEIELTPDDEKEPEVEEEDGEILPPVESWPKDPKENILQKCLVKMPLDFFAFWNFCIVLNRENPRDAFLETAGIRLVGPFDFMPNSKV